MNRPLLTSQHLTPAVQDFMAGYHRATIDEVTATIATNRIVVVGMAQNPFVKKARTALNAANVDFHYLEYGNYLSLWKPRLAIKMWSGWPTFPQVFVDGVLIGGYKETVAALQVGTIPRKS
jgi:glutaredoxin-related protein